MKQFISVLSVALLLPLMAKAQSQAEWDKVIEAAKKEGKVVVYSGYVSPDTHNAINAEFKKKYGIQVDVLTARGGGFRERVRMEQQTGRFLADVYHMAIAVTSLSIANDKTMQPHGGLPNSANLTPEMAARATDMMIPIFTINYGILYNAQTGEERGPAEIMARPARSQMARQDHDGRSAGIRRRARLLPHDLRQVRPRLS